MNILSMEDFKNKNPWQKWQDANIALYKSVFDKSKNKNGSLKNSRYNNAKMFMCAILGRDDASPLKKGHIKELNRILSETNGKFSSIMDKSTLKFDVKIKNQEKLSFVQVLINQGDSNKKFFSFSLKGDKNKIITIPKDNMSIKTNIENIGQIMLNNTLEKITEKESLNEQIKASINIISKEEIRDNEKNLLEYERYSLANGGLIIYLRYKKNTENSSILNSKEITAKEDVLKSLWNNSYKPYIKDINNKIGDELIEKYREIYKKEKKEGAKEIGNVNNNFKKSLQNTDESLSKLIDKLITGIIDEDFKKQKKDIFFNYFYAWIIDKERDIKKELLLNVRFYNSKKEKKQQKEQKKQIYFNILKKLAQQNKKRGEFTTNYAESFGGDFAEADTLARAQYKIGLKNQGNKSEAPSVEILGKDLSTNDKQVPADGKITFFYDNKKYTCTFQSKNYSLATLAKGFYSNPDQEYFVLGEDIESDKRKKDLYAYPKDFIDYGCNLIGNTSRFIKKYLKPINFIGAIPGLLRIQSYVSTSEDEIGKIQEQDTSDFYYISGYYIPSVYLLNLLNQYNIKEKAIQLNRLIINKIDGKKQIKGYYKSSGLSNLLSTNLDF